VIRCTIPSSILHPPCAKDCGGDLAASQLPFSGKCSPILASNFVARGKWVLIWFITTKGGGAAEGRGGTIGYGMWEVEIKHIANVNDIYGYRRA